MNLYSVPNLCAWVFLSSVLALVAVQTRGRWNERILAFLGFCFVTSVWQLTYGISYSLQSEAASLKLLKIGYSAVIFMPVTYLHFAASFVEVGKLRKSIIFCYVSSALFFVTLHTDLFLLGTYTYFFGHYPKANPPVHLPFMALMVVAVMASMYVLYKEWIRLRKGVRTEAEDLEFHRIKLVLFAFLFITVSASDFLPNYGFEYYPIGVVCVVCFSSVITYTILRYNLHDIQLIVKKTLVFAGLVGSVVAVVSLMAFVSQEVLAHFVTVPRWISNVFAAVIIAVSYGRLNDWLVEATDKYLFQKKYDYKQLLRKFTDEVMITVDLGKLMDMTVSTMSEVVKLENSTLLLLNKDTRQYEMVAAKGKDKQEEAVDEQEPFITFLRETHEPIGEDGDLGKVNFPPEVRERAKNLDARLCLPLHVHEDLIGVLCLGKKKSDEEFAQEDIDVLMSLAKTLSIAISNAQLFDELAKTQAEAAQKEKLAVIGTLSAGINHEICNPLGIVKAQCEAFLLDVEDGIVSGKSSQELLERITAIMRVALKQIDRATAITQKLSNFAKPIKAPTREVVNVSEEIDEVLALVGHDLELEKIGVEKRIDANLPPIEADRRQLQEVLFNLIRNAGQAITPPGNITVTGKLMPNDQIRIEIKDTGSGIPKEKLAKIFDPFYTTKDPGKGTGLGLFIVRQIVERNKGKITLESEEGVGTTFFLEFPAVKQAEVVA